MLAACAFSVACGSSDGTGEAETPEPEGPSASDPNVGLEEPDDGFMLRTVGGEIPPGEEREFCEGQRIPGDSSEEFYVSLIELGNGARSHHFGLAVAERGSLAEEELEALGAGNKKLCQGPLLGFGPGIEMLGTTQRPYGQAAFPGGVARKFYGGQFVVFNYHFYNPTSEPLQARSAAAFHVIPADEVEHEVQLFSLNNVTLDIPAGQSVSFTAECHFEVDLMVGGFTRHTHENGRDFTVWFAGGERDGEEIWTSHDWELDTEFLFEEPTMLRAGEGFRYRCNYENTTSRRIRFGTSFKDEMCMLYGPAWAPVGREVLDLPDCNIVWIDGDGIGHSAREAGGFPEPTSFEKNLCRMAYGDELDECGECQCDSCASVGIKCASDPDCSALFECLGACSDIDCTEACQPVVNEHSSGQGLLTSLWHCAGTKCPDCVPTAATLTE